MSWKATGAIKPIVADKFGNRITMAEKMVLLVLSDYVNDETGTAWPSVSRLATESLLSDRQCQRVLQSLAKREMLSIQKRRDGVKNLTSVYTLTIGDMVTPPPSDITTPSGDTKRHQSGDVAVSPKPSVSRKETEIQEIALHIIAVAPPVPKGRNIRKYAIEKTVAAIKKIADEQNLVIPDAGKLLYRAVMRWAASRKNEDMQFTKAIGSWMHQQAYSDWMSPEAAAVTGGVDALAETRKQRGVKHGN